MKNLFNSITKAIGLDEKKEEAQTPSEASIKSIPSREEIGNGVNSTPAEIKKLGGIHKLRSKIQAKRNTAKNAQQPRV
jgi:hypothetical protein